MSHDSLPRSRLPKAGRFQSFARGASRLAGRPTTFLFALLLVLLWLLSGPVFGFSDTWQLVINTATTVVTFLMVFLIQSAQNRDSEAMQLKLDELLRATRTAHNALLDLEELSEEELTEIKRHFGTLAQEARKRLRAGQSDFGCPEVSKHGAA